MLPTVASSTECGGDNRQSKSSTKMKLSFSKMQGAGNDFVVLDATRQPIALNASQVRHLADRRFGVGADQVLLVEPAPSPDVDFRYRIFNNTGGEVEHCGNGARCFLRYVRDKGLTQKNTVRVQTVNRVLELHQQDDGRVTVDMGAPDFEPHHIPFDTAGLKARREGLMDFWAVAPEFELGVVSMGNPHAVQRVSDVETAAVAQVMDRWWSSTRASRNRSTPASCKCCRVRRSGCAFMSAALARLWLVARAPAPPWRWAFVPVGWGRVWTCRRAVAC